MLSGDERVSTVDDFRLKRYEFCMEDVPSLKYDDPEAEKLISNEVWFSFLLQFNITLCLRDV